MTDQNIPQSDGYSTPDEYNERAKNLGGQQIRATDHVTTEYPAPAPSGYYGPGQPGYPARDQQHPLEQAIWHHQAPQAPVNPEKNGFGLTAVILGIVGLLFSIIPLTGFIAVILGVTGLALGFAGFSRVRKNKATNRKTAITGIVLSLLALIIGIIGIVIVFQATAQFGEDLSCIGEADTAAQIDACN